MPYKSNIYQQFLRGEIAGAGLIFIVYLEPLTVWGRRYNPRRHVVADVVSDVFWLMMEKVGTFKDEGHIHRWLYVVVRNKCINEARESRRIIMLQEDLEDMSDLSTQEKLDIKDHAVYIQARSEMIHDLLPQLPPKRRLDFQAFFFDSKTIAEIAKERNRKIITVKQNVERAGRKILQLLKKS